jgi:Tfp pilus assembly protein FimV
MTTAVVTMTERRGNRARWTTALVITPGAAALFGATTGWAMHVHPAAVAKPTAPVTLSAPVAVRPPSKDLLAVRNSLAANQRQLAAMQGSVSTLQKQLKALAAPVGATAGSAAGSAGSGGSGGSTGAGSISGGSAAAGTNVAPPAAAPAPVAPPAAAPVAPAPPPVQTTTGASGAVK